MCIGILLACLPVPYLHSWCHWTAEEGKRSPGTGVTVTSVRVWGIEARSSRKTASSLNHGAISSCPIRPF